jgi:hypothetical protein
MAQLTWAMIPGAVDLPDANLAADEPVTDYSLQKVSNNAKFAAVRPETFYGWYKNGEIVLIPVSPVDAYVYHREELEYEVAAWCTRLPVGATNGAAVKPGRANGNSGQGSLFWCDFWIDEKNEASPGLVHCEVSYWSGENETLTNDGFVKVRTIATRLSE